MFVRCRRCRQSLQIAQSGLGTLVECPACGHTMVASPVHAPQRTHTAQVGLWWFQGDPHLDRPDLIAAVRAASDAWRLRLVPRTGRRMTAREGVRLVVFGRAHVKARDPLLWRLAAQPRTDAVLLSADPADAAEVEQFTVALHHRPPVGPARLVASLRRLISGGGQPPMRFAIT